MEYSCQVMGKYAFPSQLGYLQDSCLLLFLGVPVCVGVCVDSSLNLQNIQRGSGWEQEESLFLESEIFEGSWLN